MRKEPIYIKKTEKTKNITLSWAGVVSQLGVFTPPPAYRGGVKISLHPHYHRPLDYTN